MDILRHLGPFLKKHRSKYIGGVLILILVDALQLITPEILKRFSDDLVNGTISSEKLYQYAGLIMLVAVGIAGSRFLWRMLIIASSRRLEAWMRARLFAHLETLPQRFYNEHKTGDLMAHATNDLNAIRMAFGPGIIMATDALFLTIMTVAIMIINIDLKLTLLALLPMPIIAISVRLLGKLIQERFKLVQEAFSNLSDKVQESFSGIRVIKAFHQEDKDVADFDEKNMTNLKANITLAKTFATMFPLITLISSLSLIIALTFGATRVIDGDISIGSYVAFLSYIELLTWPMMAIGWVINVIQRGIASLKRINVLLDENSELYNAEEEEDIDDFPVEIRNLSFTYPGTDEPVLRNVSLQVPSGSSLGILGRTGSGKTTITNLLLRLYDFPDGTIYLGGKDLKSYPIHQTRNLIGIVPQDNFLFSTTIAKNIAFSQKEVDMDKVYLNTETAQIRSEIEDLPKAFDTLLGERGINLSGGQKQRTSIARVLYKAPPVMILDDALSAVDTNTEENILRFLKNEIGKRTSIIISHRISTLKNLDQIIVMDEGEIKEKGTHSELIAKQGLYFDTYQKQLLEEKINQED